MITIVYASRAVTPANEASLAQLLSVARSRNGAEDVSGMLLYAYGSFLQQLEGEDDAVDRIFTSIEADPRHTDLRLLSRRPIDARRYRGWAMGFDHPDAAALAARLPGFRPTTRHPLVSAELVHTTEIAETVLGLFAQDSLHA